MENNLARKLIKAMWACMIIVACACICTGTFSIYSDWMTGVTEINPISHIVETTRVNVSLQFVCTSIISCNETQGDLWEAGNLAVDLIVGSICYSGLIVLLFIIQGIFQRKCGPRFMLSQVIHRYFGVVVCSALLLVAFVKEKKALDNYAEETAMDGVRYKSGFTECVLCIAMNIIIGLCNTGELAILCMVQKPDEQTQTQPLIDTPSSV